MNDPKIVNYSFGRTEYFRGQNIRDTPPKLVPRAVTGHGPTYAAPTLVPISTRSMRKQETICERKILCKRPIAKFLTKNISVVNMHKRKFKLSKSIDLQPEESQSQEITLNACISKARCCAYLHTYM